MTSSQPDPEREPCNECIVYTRYIFGGGLCMGFILVDMLAFVSRRKFQRVGVGVRVGVRVGVCV